MQKITEELFRRAPAHVKEMARKACRARRDKERKQFMDRLDQRAHEVASQNSR